MREWIASTPKQCGFNKPMSELALILDFLPCPTPVQWLEKAAEPDSFPVILVDHANNELKAAQAAMSLINRYRAGFQSLNGGKKGPKDNGLRLNLTDQRDLLNKMSRLAREELRHFEQVLAIMTRRGMEYHHLGAGRYAGQLRKGIRTFEPARLVDTLITGAFIEARSCERFAALAPVMEVSGDEELAKFYRSLLKSEGRHFQDYLRLAEAISLEPIEEQIGYFSGLEQDAIESPDSEFRFHSGVPA